MIRLCEICNKGFQTINPRKKFCSPECGKQGTKIRDANKRGAELVKDCPICGKQFEIHMDGARTKYCSEGCFNGARRIENREIWRRAHPGWDEGINTHCGNCGASLEGTSSKAKYCSKKCANTVKDRKLHRAWDEYVKEINKQKAETQARLEEERRQRLRVVECARCGEVFETYREDQHTCSSECTELIRNEEYKTERQSELEALQSKECAVCKEPFKSWHSAQMTCSIKCSRIYRNRMNRLKRYNVEIIDSDISLQELYKRDDGDCHLCGEQCDYKDYTKDNGAFIVGPSYPSIDHLLPRSKGGVHSWDNIKLAHHYCNTIKNDDEMLGDTKERYANFIGLAT